ncbi:2'-5' RNA ligase family protein [Patescibacteria group bacterium]|nr:2'-5' RNA ligase family protein [Patescibacteria group bacterium]
MSKIAIDIVLLPPENIMDKAIEINNELIDDPIKLNKENCLPHISLCMGVIEEKDLLRAKEILNKIGKDFSKLSLTINKINSENTCFNIKKDKKLQKLHETVITRLSPCLSYDATIDMCFFPPPIVLETLFWINNYREKFSFENFHPHITLGISKLSDKELNINFVASKVAICHLGNYCTCRKILHSIIL